MSTRHERLADLFALARRVPEAQRAQRLLEECPDDEAMREEVLALLSTADAPDPLLDDPAGVTLRRHSERALQGAAAQETGAADWPARIGAYAIIGLLGEGGMGRVYEAEQDRPRRRVALKVLRMTSLSSAARRRFELEAEIVGRLQHPGIAQVLEAGVADVPGFGLQPYLAMELVRGTTLVRHADEARLGVRARISLLAACCDAVQHAHERGVIHRDLKPANILVGADSRPRIVDFGIARVADPELRGGASLTGTGHVIGTLAYMAPEQVRGRSSETDTRSDVYALGAVGWELLTGRPPHVLTDASLPEAARRIAEDELPRLSSIDRSLRGDIETILGKALEKDRARRYASASELAADLRRYLADEPIFARPASAGYQLRKFARRHVAIVAGASLAVMALLLGTGAALWQAREARARAADAEAERAIAERLAYRASLGAAVGAIAGDNFPGARRLLDEAPPALRGWEWEVLRRSLDLSGGVVARIPGCFSFERLGDDGVVGALVRGPSGPGLLRIDVASRRVLDAEAFPIETSRPLVLPEEAMAGAARWVVLGKDEREVAVFDTTGAERMRVLRCSEPGYLQRPFTTVASGRLVMSAPEPWREDLPDVELAACDTVTGIAAWRQRVSLKLRAVASPDGSRVALGNVEDGVVHVLDAADGRLLARSEPPGSDLSTLSFSPDGRTLLAGASNDGHLTLYDTATLHLIARRNPGRVSHAACGYVDGARLIVSAGPGGSLATWTPALEELIAKLPGHSAPISNLLELPSRRELLSLDAEGEIRAWSVDDLGHRAGVLGDHGTYVYAAAWSRDGSRIVVPSFDDRVHLWDAAAERRLRVHSELAAPERRIPGEAVTTADGSVLIGFHDHSLARIDPSSGDVLARCENCGGSRVALDPSGTRALTTSRSDVEPKGILRMVDARSLETEWSSAGFDPPVAWSPDGRILVARLRTPESDGDLVMIDAVTRAVMRRMPLEPAPCEEAAWSADGAWLAVASEAGRVAVFAADGRRLATIAHPGRVFAVTFSPDGSRLMMGGDGGELRIFETERWTELVALPGHSFYLYSLAWSPDGRTLLSASGDGSVRLWR